MLARKIAGWILTANGDECHIYARNVTTGKLDIVKELLSKESRMRSRQIGTDSPGRVFESAGAMRHAMEPHETFQHHARLEFARKIAGFLNEAAGKDEFYALILAASPVMLGEIRSFLDENTQERIMFQINKDLTHVSPQELSTYLYKKAG